MNRRELGLIVLSAVLAGMSLAVLVGVRSSYPLGDAGAYWDAAERIRAGGSLYPPLADYQAATVYRYAPWFAWAWVPLTYLPRAFVEVCWVAVLLAAATYSLLRSPRPLAALIGPFLLWSAVIGNVEALMIAGLVYGVGRRSGPIWIGLAASLKITPILFVLVYLGRRQWSAAALAVAVGCILWLPVLAFDTGAYPMTPAGTLSLLSVLGVPVYVGLGALVACLVVLRPSWALGSLAVVLWLPRMLLYDLSYFLVGGAAARGRRP